MAFAFGMMHSVDTIFYDNFESATFTNTYGGWTSTQGTIAHYSTLTDNEGQALTKPPSGQEYILRNFYLYCYKNFVSNDVWVKLMWRNGSPTTDDTGIFGLQDVNGGNLAVCYQRRAGHLALSLYPPNEMWETSVTPAPYTWHTIKAYFHYGVVGKAKLWFNGELVVNKPTQNMGTASLGRFATVGPSYGGSSYYDSIGVYRSEPSSF